MFFHHNIRGMNVLKDDKMINSVLCSAYIVAIDMLWSTNHSIY
jgi:hypothetical protein